VKVDNRVQPGQKAVALETTLLTHGVPRATALPLADDLRAIAEAEGAVPVLTGVIDGRPVVGLTESELAQLLREEPQKVNTSNLGLAIHRRSSGSTTVSATMELCAAVGVRVFATGGIGGVHADYASRLDISADLAALARFPVAVVCSGVKAILDVPSTREALEAIGVPVVGFRTDRFPAFYLRDGGVDVDGTFEEEEDLASFLDTETYRRRAGVLVANPIPRVAEISRAHWNRWLAVATERADGIHGRDLTPKLLALLHEVSDGATLRANIELARSNTRLGARLAARLPI